MITKKTLIEYIKTHEPPYKIALLVFVMGLPLNMFINYISVLFIASAYLDYTSIPIIFNNLESMGWTEDTTILLFNIAGMWSRFAILSLVVVTLWYGVRHFLNRDEFLRINIKDCVAAISIIGSAYGILMLSLFPWF